MSEWRSFRFQALLFAAMALSAFAFSQQSALLLAVVVLGTALSWTLVRRTTTIRRGEVTHAPRWLAAAALIALLFIAGVWGYTKDDATLLPSAIGFSISLVLLWRLFARRSLSDERQVLMLSSVLLIVAVLESNDLLVALAVLSATMQGVNCVIRYRLAAAAQASHITETLGRGWFGGVRAVVGASPRADLTRTIRIALGLVFAFTLTLFVLFPRNPHPTGGLFALRSGSASEFSDHISLMSPQRLTPSQREMFTVQWLGPDGEPLVAPGILRLRGVILELYDVATSTWVGRTAPRQRFVISEGDEFQSLTSSQVDERFNTFTQRVVIRQLRSDAILSAWAPISILGGTAQVYTFDPRTLAIRTMDIESAGPIGGYDLRVQPFASDGVLAALHRGEPRIPQPPTFPVESIRDEALAILASAGDGELARESGADDPAARWARNLRIARVFESELTSEQFRYTLDLRKFIRLGDRDPIELFLKQYRFGHCEFFASALCALCQSVGVDARIVTGFLARDFQSTAARYIVRESDAHAWVEIRTGRFQWTPLDATPADNLAPTSSDDESWASVLRVLFEPIERVWQLQVAQFDARAQNALVGRASESLNHALRTTWSALEQTALRTGQSARVGVSGYIWFGSIFVSLAFTLAAALIWSRRLNRARRALGVGRRDRVRARAAMRDGAFYVDALDLLSERGIARPSNASPRAFVQIVRGRNPRAGEIFAQIVERFYAIRFGGERSDARARAHDRLSVGALRTALSE